MGESILYRLMPILKVILFIFFIFLCLLPLGMIAEFNFISIDRKALISDIVVEGALILTILGALLMMFRVLPQVHFTDVFVDRRGMFAGFMKGSLIGVGLILLCAALLLASGNVVLSVGKISVESFIGYLALFLLVGIFEELMFRTFPLFAFAERYPVLVSITINGLLFGFVHLGNPGFTWLAMLNITLAGALFSVYTLLKKNVSWAIGIHFAWNFTQGILLGYKVSGTDTPGILLAKPVGADYLSGGAFGIEGSVVCTAVLVALIAWLLLRNKIMPIESKEDFHFAEETSVE